MKYFIRIPSDYTEKKCVYINTEDIKRIEIRNDEYDEFDMIVVTIYTFSGYLEEFYDFKTLEDAYQWIRLALENHKICDLEAFLAFNKV